MPDLLTDTNEFERTNTIVHPRYGCAIGAVYSVVAIPGGVPIANCGPGCASKQFSLLSGANGYQGTNGAGAGAMPSANVGENEVVFGGTKKLDALVKSALRIMKGDLFVVVTGCSGELVGDDVGSVVRGYQRAGKPVVFADAAGFKGSNVIGHEIVMRAIIDQFVGRYEGKKQKGLLNLFFEVPYFNTNWRGDFIEMKRILEGAGLRVNVLFGPESRGTAEWKDIPKAQFNLVVSPWVGLGTAEHLKAKYNQPYLHVPIVPVGEEATTAFIREVVGFAGADPRKSEAFIKEEARLYYYFLEHFAEFFSEFWFGLPSRFAVAADASTNLALTKFLADQMGVIPVKQIVTDNPPEKFREGIRRLCENITEGVSAEVDFIEDGYVIEREIKNADFGGAVPLILGSSWETDIAAELKGLLVRVGVPNTEEVVINRSFIGYRGALTFMEKVYSAAVGSGS
jgi:nitrogenase molybdenum-iron protein beta chain